MLPLLHLYKNTFEFMKLQFLPVLEYECTVFFIIHYTLDLRLVVQHGAVFYYNNMGNR